MTSCLLTFFDMSDDLLTFFNCHEIVTVNRPSFDNARSHVTVTAAFRPITETARSLSDDNYLVRVGACRAGDAGRHRGVRERGHGRGGRQQAATDRHGRTQVPLLLRARAVASPAETYYYYGPSFYITVASFVGAEITGVLSVHVYIHRYKQAYHIRGLVDLAVIN